MVNLIVNISLTILNVYNFPRSFLSKKEIGMIYFQSFILAPSNRLSVSSRKKPTTCSAGVRSIFEHEQIVQTSDLIMISE